MRDINNLPGVNYLDYADEIRFLLLNSTVNNEGKLTHTSDIVEWNRIVDILIGHGILCYEKFELGGAE